jgi:hypothetical protein
MDNDHIQVLPHTVWLPELAATASKLRPVPRKTKSRISLSYSFPE